MDEESTPLTESEHARSRSANAEAKREYAKALREILDELQATEAPAETLREETLRLREVAAVMRHHAPNADPSTGAEGEAPGESYSGMETFFDRSPIVGHANPLAPPAVLAHVPDERAVRGHVEFSHAFEGGPGLVHGGFLAALLDEALGCATIYSGSAGMTGEYTLRYHAPTRIKVPLRFEARFDGREGRKLFLSADLWDGETRTVSAKGTFIAVDAEKFAAFNAERGERIGQRS